MKNSSFIFFALLSFFFFQACSDKIVHPDGLISKQQNQEIFSKKTTFVSPDKSMVLNLEFSSEKESILQEVDLSDFVIKPVFEAPKSNPQNQHADNADDEPWDDTEPSLSIKIEKITFPEDAIGYSFSEKNSSKRGWVTTKLESSTGSSCYQIVKTNSLGYTKYKYSAKFVGNFLWNQLDKGTLFSNLAQDMACAGGLNKHKASFNNKGGSTSILYMWDF